MSDNQSKNTGPVYLNLRKPPYPVSSSLAARLNKDDIRNLIKPLGLYLKENKFVTSNNSNPDVIELLENFLSKSMTYSLKKDELLTIYNSFILDEGNAMQLTKTDERLKKAWHHILSHPEVPASEIETILGRKLEIPYSYWGINKIELPFFPAFINDESDIYYIYSREKKYRLYVTPKTRKHLIEDYFKDINIEPIVVSELPKNSNLKIENFESNITFDLSYLTGLTKTDSIMTSGGNISVSKLKTIHKTYKTPDFLAGSAEWPLDRMELLTLAFMIRKEARFKESKGQTDLESLGRFIVGSMAQHISGSRFNAFLPNLKGFRKPWAQTTNVGHIISAVHDLILPSQEGWLSLKNLIIRFLCINVSGQNQLTIIPKSQRSRHTLKRTDKEDEYSYAKNLDWFKEVDLQFILNWIRFLCGAGLIEMAIDNPEDYNDELRNDPLDGIRYVRMTEFGKYAFKLKKKYEPEVKVDTDIEIDVDEKSGVIAIIGGNNPFDMFLRQICGPIGKNRYRLTVESLISNSRTSDQLKQNVNALSKIINLGKYPRLKSITDNALERVDCIVPVKDVYYCLRIRTDLPELSKLIAANKEIRKHVILAEKGFILVQTLFLSEFKNFCRSRGYLLD